ncbi:MAG: SMC family ATPase [Candidatus Bathyarchaeia archaeon]
MKLLGLYASNFKKLKFDGPLELPEGVTVISGLNEAGKSTVLDAILYALYGRVIRPPGHVKDEDLICYGADRAVVSLDFEIAGRRYRVRREIRRGKANSANLDEVLPDGRLRPLATKVREVTRAVEGLLGGISFSELVSSNVVAQKDLDRLIREGGERHKVINAFLNLESFNSALEGLNEERKDLEGTGPSRPGLISIERARLEALKAELEELNRRRAELEELRRRIGELSKERAALESRLRELEPLRAALAKYGEALAERERLEAELKGKKELLRKHEEEVGALEERIRSAEAELAGYEGLPLEEAPRIQQALEAVREIEGRRAEAEGRALGLEGEIERLERELEGFDPAELRRAREARRRLGKYFSAAIASIILFAFSFALGAPMLLWSIALATGLALAFRGLSLSRLAKRADLAEALLGKEALLANKRAELSRLREEIARALEGVGRARMELRGILSGLKRYGPMISGEPSPELAAEKVLERLSEEGIAKEGLESMLRGLRDSLEDAMRRVDALALQSEIEALEGRLSAIELPGLPDGVRFSKELLEAVSRERDDAKARLERVGASIEAHEERMREDERYIADHGGVEAAVRDQEARLRDLERRLRIVKAAIEGIEATAEALRNRVRPSVERYMGQILPRLTSGRYKAVLLDESFGIRVWDPDAGEFRPKDVFSGGTEDQFLLAMRLAFALSLMPEAKGVKPDFLFLDEPLGSSDEVRRSGIIEYLTSELPRLFGQIFVISHVGGLEELLPNVIRLEDGRVVGR